MRDRPEQVLKLVCLLLAALVCAQVARVFLRGAPLKNLRVPSLPQLAAYTDPTNAPTGQRTNSISNTNPTTSSTTGTNSPAGQLEGKGTNVASSRLEQKGTNVVSTTSLEEVVKAPVPSGKANTNPVALNQETNGRIHATNSVSAALTSETNQAEKTARSGTNSPSGTNQSGALAKTKAPGAPPDMGKRAPELSAAVKSRIDRITQSEILAPVMRPMPMALLGIAGDQAFLRSPEGQTGVIKEGAELGTIKLLKIGTNRVLVEEKGEKKELMIFSGFGGESLVPKEEKPPKDEKGEAKKEQKKNEEKDKQANETTKKTA